MRHMLKVLLITIVGLFVDNAEGTGQSQTIFDLPIDDTPGLQKNGPSELLIRKSILNKKTQCILVIVPKSEADDELNKNGGNIINAMEKRGNIYFPADGTQPTTPEAVEYSCANVDNRENSPITEWYMMMFGVIDKNGGNSNNDYAYIKAGWNANATAAERIISFDASVDATLVNDPNIPGAQIGKRDLFEREFRKIASTSVGRVLLYRILIEIRRRQGNDEGCTEFVLSPLSIVVRNRCRYLYVVYKEGDFAFRPQGELVFSNAIVDETVIGGAVRGTGYSKVILCPDTVSISLFHEMLHWYHHLRNIDRMNKEAGKGPDITYNFNTHFLGKYYWGGLNFCANEWSGRSISEEPWLASGLFGLKNYVNFEELRTVLGVTYRGSIDQYQQNYLQGEDLSENLYRMCVGVPLRFGYGRDCFCEDTKVIDRVMNSCLKNFLLYSKAHDLEAFNPNIGRSGLGKSRFPQ